MGSAMSNISSIQYNPHNYSSNMLYMSPYPNTLTMNNTLEHFDYSSLLVDTSMLKPIDSPFDIEPSAPIDNKEHDTDPTNLFYFHQPDNNAANTLYYGGFPADFPAANMFLHLGGPLFTDPYNYPYTTPSGHTGRHNYLVSIPRTDSPPSLIDPDIRNPNRFDAVYGLDKAENTLNSWPFDSSKYNDFTGTSMGEFMHWMEVFAKQSAMIPHIPYIYIPSLNRNILGNNPAGIETVFGVASATPPLVSVFDKNYGGLANSEVWRTYVDKHIMDEHGGIHDTTTPVIYSV